MLFICIIIVGLIINYRGQHLQKMVEGDIPPSYDRGQLPPQMTYKPGRVDVLE